MAKSTEVRVVNSTVSDTFVPNVDEGVIVADTGATVWLQGTSVSSNKAVLPLIAKTEYTDGDGAIFSDRADPWFFWDSNSEQEQRETGQVPSDTSAFLSFDDEWFASVRKVRSMPHTRWGVLVRMAALPGCCTSTVPTSVSYSCFFVPMVSDALEAGHVEQLVA